MVDAIAVGVLIGGATLFLARQTFAKRKARAAVDAEVACGCGVPGKTGCKH